VFIIISIKYIEKIDTSLIVASFQAPAPMLGFTFRIVICCLDRVIAVYGYPAAQVAGKDDITLPELAGELEAACGARAGPASISRWLIRNGYRFKKSASGRRIRSPRYPPGARGMAD
jgi:hypothetical protein